MSSFEEYKKECERMLENVGPIPPEIKLSFGPNEFFSDNRIILVNQYGLEFGYSTFYINNFEKAKEKAIALFEKNHSYIFPVTMYIYNYMED